MITPTQHQTEQLSIPQWCVVTVGAPGGIRTPDPRLRSIISPFFRFRRFRESSKIKGFRNRIFHVFHEFRPFFLLMPPQLPPQVATSKLGGNQCAILLWHIKNIQSLIHAPSFLGHQFVDALQHGILAAFRTTFLAPPVLSFIYPSIHVHQSLSSSLLCLTS